MPAAKSIANHDRTPNSGFYPSRPSVILPNRLNAMMIANTMNTAMTIW